MNLRSNLLRKSLIIPFLALIIQSPAFAEPFLIPGFLGIESSYIEAPDADSDSTNAYFTITNLHNEPILILSASGDIFDNATLRDSNNEELDYIELLPRERLVMQSDGLHIQLNEIDESIAAGDILELTLLVRRGREAIEYVEEFFDNSIRKTLGGGIPNEKEYVVHISIRN